MKSIINEVWNNSCQSKDYSHDEDYMTYSQFEKAVKELLEMQREECERAYCHRPKWDHDIAVAILNAELK